MFIRRFAIALTITLSLFATGSSQAFAQVPGYQFGVGLSYSGGYGGGGRGGLTYDGKRPPYFALHPPVYYSHVVPRPYGVSPFAAPPGVMPVEMSIAPEPVTISNPFFKGPQAAPVDHKKSAKTEPKVTLIPNPYSKFARVDASRVRQVKETTQDQAVEARIAKKLSR